MAVQRDEGAVAFAEFIKQAAQPDRITSAPEPSKSNVVAGSSLGGMPALHALGMRCFGAGTGAAKSERTCSIRDLPHR